MPDAILVFAAVLPWQFFASALAESSASLIGNASLISKVYFPRLIIPLAAVATAFVDFLDHARVARGVDGVVRRCAGRATLVACRCSSCAVRAAVARPGTAAGGAERDVPRLPLRRAVHRPVRAVRLAGRVSTAHRCRSAGARVYALNPMVGIIDGFRWSILGGARRSIRGAR